MRQTAQVLELLAQPLLFPGQDPTTENVAVVENTAVVPVPVGVGHAPTDIVPARAPGDIALVLAPGPAPGRVNVDAPDLDLTVDAPRNVSDGAKVKILLF